MNMKTIVFTPLLLWIVVSGCVFPWMLGFFCTEVVAGTESCGGQNVPVLKLNQEQFQVGDRLLLRLDNSVSHCNGSWDVYLALLPHVDRINKNGIAKRVYLPKWTTTRQPAKRNVQLKPGIMEIIDVVVEENLPAGNHRLELYLDPVDETLPLITVTRDFFIQLSLQQDFEIVVDLAETGGPVKSFSGFLHGLSPKKHETQVSQEKLKQLILDLKPGYWRLNNDYVRKAAQQSGAAVTLVLGDLLAQDGIHPWEIRANDIDQWQKFEQHVREIIRRSKASGMRIDYWDLWNEPDAKQSWGGTVEQFLEYVGHVVPLLREEDPQAKIVAPSTAENFFRIPLFWEQFLNYLISREIRIDAVSWHEFHRPEDIPDTAAQVREAIGSIPWLQDVELHVNEYGGGQNHLIPGWQLGWLYYLDKAEIDWANHACWYWPRGEGRGNVSECVRGLNGLLHPATLEPLPVYWVNYWQAQMAGDRLLIDTEMPRTVALGAYDRKNSEIRVVFGRFSCGVKMKWCRFNGSQVIDQFLPTKPLNLVIKNMPQDFSRVNVTLSRVSGQDPEIELLQPELISQEELEVIDGIVELQFQHFRDGDVYHVLLRK